jgi:hypothetical protein
MVLVMIGFVLAIVVLVMGSRRQSGDIRISRSRGRKSQRCRTTVKRLSFSVAI